MAAARDRMAAEEDDTHAHAHGGGDPAAGTSSGTTLCTRDDSRGSCALDDDEEEWCDEDEDEEWCDEDDNDDDEDEDEDDADEDEDEEDEHDDGDDCESISSSSKSISDDAGGRPHGAPAPAGRAWAVSAALASVCALRGAVSAAVKRALDALGLGGGGGGSGGGPPAKRARRV